jgi:hypothetical protein
MMEGTGPRLPAQGVTKRSAEEDPPGRRRKRNLLKGGLFLLQWEQAGLD